MSEDFGWQRDKEQSRALLIIKKAFMIGAILFSISCFIYITISAYYFVYHDQNNDVEIIKSPTSPIKIIEEENKGGMTIKDMDKTIYENIVGNSQKESFERGVKIINLPEEPISPFNHPAKQIFGRDNESKLVEENTIVNHVENFPTKTKQSIPKYQNPPKDNNHNKKPSDSKLIVYDSNAEFKTIGQSTNDASANRDTAPVIKEPEKIIKNTAQAKTKKNVSRVQIAATNSASSADEYWERLNNKHHKLFAGLKHFVQEIKLGRKGTFYRLQIGDFRNQVEAEEFCVKFISQTQKNKSDCIVVE